MPPTRWGLKEDFRLHPEPQHQAGGPQITTPTWRVLTGGPQVMPPVLAPGRETSCYAPHPEGPDRDLRHCPCPSTRPGYLRPQAGLDGDFKVHFPYWCWARGPHAAPPLPQCQARGPEIAPPCLVGLDKGPQSAPPVLGQGNSGHAPHPAGLDRLPEAVPPLPVGLDGGPQAMSPSWCQARGPEALPPARQGLTRVGLVTSGSSPIGRGVARSGSHVILRYMSVGRDLTLRPVVSPRL